MFSITSSPSFQPKTPYELLYYREDGSTYGHLFRTSIWMLILIRLAEEMILTKRTISVQWVRRSWILWIEFSIFTMLQILKDFIWILMGLLVLLVLVHGSLLLLFMDRFLKAPSFIYFSSLKTLAFHSLTFSDDKSTQNLFSNCPVLQELTLTYCGWKNIKTLTISIPTLKRLTIEDDPLWSDAADGLSCAVKIYTPNLVDLKFTSNLKIHFHLCELSSIVNAYIDLLYRERLQQVVYPRVIGVLRGICNVECLTISEDTLLSILDVENIVECLPTFHNMTDLELNAEFRSSFTEILIKLLEKSPLLEFLDLAWGFDPDDIHNHNVDLMLERVPSCCCVKKFSLSCFEGKPAEMHFLKILLKNATLLERMTLYCGPVLSEDLEKEVEVQNQLRAFPRGSESCVIELF